jgi:hypothetical protein
VSSFTLADGSQHQMADVWFAKEKATPAVQLGDLLAAAPSELLAHDSATAAPAPQVATAAIGAEQHRLLAEEAQRIGPLI